MDAVQASGTGLVEVLAALRFRAALIGACALVAVCAAVASLIVITPRYSATALIMLDPMTSSALRVAGGEFSSLPVDAAKIASVAATIGSNEFLDQIIKAQRLNEDPEFVGPTRNALMSRLLALMGRSDDDQSGSARVAAAEVALRKAMTVARDGLTYVIKIDFVSEDPAKARLLAQTISESYVKNKVEARIISPARLPDSPSFPRPKIFILGALGLGLLVGAAVAFLVERSTNAFATPTQIEQCLNLPVLASIPALTANELGHEPTHIDIINYMATHPFSQFAESMRNIRVGLHRDPDHAPKVVQFASPMPSEGKSTLTACVAISLAAAGIRTILIECDLRRASCLDAFRVKNRRGVAEVLLGRATFNDVVSPTFQSCLWVIPAGNGACSPPELTGSDRLKKLVEDAAAAADFVIIDSPAMEMVLDAAIIAQIVDETIIVAKWRSSSRMLVARTVEQIRRSHGSISGVVLNGVDMRTANYCGYWSKDYIRKTGIYYATVEKRSQSA